MTAKEIAEQLADRWITEERLWRQRYQEAMDSGDARGMRGPFSRADQLSKCRRELQEAFKLVVVP